MIMSFKSYFNERILLESPQGKIQKYNITDPGMINFVFRFEDRIKWSSINSIDDINNAIDFKLKEITSPENYRISVDDINWTKETALLKVAALEGNEQAQRSLHEFDKDPEKAKTLVINNINEGKDSIVNSWLKYFSNNDVYSPSFQFIILDSILKDTKTSRNPPPKANPQTIARIYGKIQNDPKTTFKLKAVYDAFLVDDEKEGLETIISGNGEWIRIPSYNNDPKNYEENVSKLMSLAAPNWCVRQKTMAESYIKRQNSDFWLYIIDGKHGKTAVGSVRVVNNNIEEISGTEGGSSQELHDKYLPVVSDLVEKKDFSGKDFYLINLLIKQKNYNKLDQLVKSGDININGVDKIGYTPLIHATYNNNTELAKLLIAKGADVNVVNKDGYTPLIWAINYKNPELAKLLIAKGADVNGVDKNGYTPLIWATYNNNTELAKLLIAKGADVNAVNKAGSTPLILTTYNYNTELVELLKKHGATK